MKPKGPSVEAAASRFQDPARMPRLRVAPKREHWMSRTPNCADKSF